MSLKNLGATALKDCTIFIGIYAYHLGHKYRRNRHLFKPEIREEESRNYLLREFQVDIQERFGTPECEKEMREGDFSRTFQSRFAILAMVAPEIDFLSTLDLLQIEKAKRKEVFDYLERGEIPAAVSGYMRIIMYEDMELAEWLKVFEDVDNMLHHLLEPLYGSKEKYQTMLNDLKIVEKFENEMPDGFAGEIELFVDFIGIMLNRPYKVEDLPIIIDHLKEKIEELSDEN